MPAKYQRSGLSSHPNQRLCNYLLLWELGCPALLTSSGFLSHYHPPIAQAFERKIQSSGSDLSKAQHKKGCNCKRSHCLKKYCECYQVSESELWSHRGGDGPRSRGRIAEEL